MATGVTVRTVLRNERFNASRARQSMKRAIDTFHEVERACTRFDPDSPLMRANQSPNRYHQVPTLLYLALEEAFLAHERTQGAFDPRVIKDLVALGYDRSLAFTSGGVTTTNVATSRDRRGRGGWRPRFRDGTHEVRLTSPVDLGGIGKGLAVRWACRQLAPLTPNFLVEAGGDCYCSGVSSDGGAWRVGVEDPSGGLEPLAVLSLRDRAVTTSSIRLRRWRSGDDDVHHLIDPRTGRSGGNGLAAVTVVGDDPATAEVDCKFLFLAGREGIAARALRFGIAALWVDSSGVVTSTDEIRPHLVWQRS